MTPAFLTGSCSIFGGIPLGCVECTGAELCFDGLCSFVVGGKEGEGGGGEGYYALTLIISLWRLILLFSCAFLVYCFIACCDST